MNLILIKHKNNIRYMYACAFKIRFKLQNLETNYQGLFMLQNL